MQKLAAVFGGFGSKIKREQAEVASLTAEYQRLAEVKVAASSAYVETPLKGTNKDGEVAEEVAQVSTSLPATGSKTKVDKEIENEIATSGAIETGVAKSSGLASSVVRLGSKLLGIASALWATWDAGKDIYAALKKGSTSSWIKAGTNTVGTLIGTDIDLATGGPMGSIIGSQLGEVVGSSKTVQKIVESAGNAIKKSNEEMKKEGYVVNANGAMVVEKSSLAKAQKSIVRDITKTMDKADLSVLKMSVQTDDASLSKARKNLEGFYSSILKTAEKQSQKRADAEKSVVDQMYKRHKISKKQYDEYIKSIDESDKKRQSSQKKTYDSLIKSTNKYNEELKRVTSNGEGNLNRVAYLYDKCKQTSKFRRTRKDRNEENY